MGQIIVDSEALNRLGLDPNAEYQVVPVTVRDIIPVKVNTQLSARYTLFTEAATLRNPDYCNEKFPNDNAFILNDVRMYSDAQFTAAGSASTLQTQDFFRRFSNLKISLDTTELVSLNQADYTPENRRQEDATLVGSSQNYPWIDLPYPIYIGKREQVRFEYTPASLLTTANIAADIPYINNVFNDSTSNGFTLLEVRFRGVKLVLR